MGLLTALLEQRQSPENPKTNLATAAFWLIDALGGTASHAGVRVNPRTALGSTAVQAAIRVIAESVGSLPLLLYERLAPRGKRRASEHPLFEVLHEQPNPEITRPVFFETLQAHLLLWGNAFAEIQRNGRGEVIALWPLLPEQTRVGRDTVKGKFYLTRGPDGMEIPLPLEDVLHVPGLSFNGREGLSPIALARESVGLALAAQEYGARFFGNNAEPGGVVEHPGRLSPEAHAHIRTDWERLHTGLSNAHRVAILEEGMKWHQMGVPNKDAQFLETRKFQVTEIARLYRVPPHMIGDLERATFSNIEHQAIDFVVHTLRPWLVRWEVAINRSLVSANQRGRFFAEFLVDGLLRGDTQSRYQAYAQGRQWGWLSADDVRELENMNPLPDERGTIYLTPINMIPAGAEAVAAPPNRLRAIVRAVAGQLAHKEKERVRALARQWADAPIDHWQRAVIQFYAEFAPVIAKRLQIPPGDAARYCGQHQALLRDGLMGLDGDPWQAAVRELAERAITGGEADAPDS